MKTFFEEIKNRIAANLRHRTMRAQLVATYFLAVFTPLVLVSVILISFTVNRMTTYQQDLTDANNRMVKSMIYEITGQILNISEEVIENETVLNVLSEQTPAPEKLKNVNAVLDTLTRSYLSIESVNIYYDGVGVEEYTHLKSSFSVMKEDWFRTAGNQYSGNWVALKTQDEYGNEYWNIAMARQIPLYGTSRKAVLVVSVSANYLDTRIIEDNYITVLSLEKNVVGYSSNRADWGRRTLFKYPTDDPYYARRGKVQYYETSYLGSVSSLKPSRTDSIIRITVLSKNATNTVTQTAFAMALIIMLALLLPAIIMTYFTRDLVHQVSTLRDEMNRASQEQYDLQGFEGCHELTQAYDDLQTLIEHIQDRDARMYRNEIVEQKLLNEQQKMEFKMLASQINPHFLYNTLEMIRMKALAVGDKETATAIKLLGQSMRYVLDNTGTEFTTLAKELKHIETYLQIQRLRFGDRVNYFLMVDEGIDLDTIPVLPLLLQPIVENAVLHGLEEVESGGRIEVHIHKETYNSLCIDISDNGCGMDEDTLENMRKNLDVGHISDRFGIGLYNINRRLRINYGEGYGVTIDSEEGVGTKVSCRLRMNPGLDNRPGR